GTKEQIIARIIAAEQRPASMAAPKGTRKAEPKKAEPVKTEPGNDVARKSEEPAEDGKDGKKRSILKVRLIPQGEKRSAKS
ncbi:MAG TPA: hypothetical protein PKI40_09585, partial [Methanomassiliicoccaceae archaeon]|nr:hypothetical protein [Methanomassiliicoccaceae archaeon]